MKRLLLTPFQTTQGYTEWSRLYLALVVLGIWLGASLLAVNANAQLISPGELSQVHASFEGVNNCTTCHQLGQVGISNDKCLECHTPVSNRITASTGLHAGIAEQNCGNCHKDHFGRDFDVLRFEPDTFDHEESGFSLVGAHIDVECRSCHQPENITSADVRDFKGAHDALEKTWLGLPTQCAPCHGDANVHGDQFEGQDCGVCHQEDQWEEQPNFDHDQTTFPLTGRHIEVSCEGCHKPFADEPDIVHFANVPAQTCESCHTDVHQGSLGAECSACHITDGWNQFTADFPTDAFNHDLTDFPLRGGHATLNCSSCHSTPAPRTEGIQIVYASASLGSSFPEPAFDTCLSCHTDSFHNGVFEDSPGGAVCDNCHFEEGWSPTSYDLTRHNEQSAFALTGAHLVTPCFACHQSTETQDLVFHFEDQQCEACHADSNPHGTQFQSDGATVCESCHGTNSWEMDGTFDHAETRFPLIGQHVTASCDGCHPVNETPAGLAVQQFTDISLECATCHRDDSPHEQQFEGASCDTCHDSHSFFVEVFDHDNTRFPLDGAHEGVACSSCHQTEKNTQGLDFVRYKPLKMECQDCHDNLN